MNIYTLIKVLSRKGETVEQIAKELNLEREIVKRYVGGVRWSKI